MDKRGWCLVVVTCAAACGDNSSNRQLEITDPSAAAGSVKKLCLGDDKSSVLDGLQYNVRVTATGFANGDLVELSVDGAAPDPQVGQAVAGSAVTFSNFTIAEGEHTLEARSEDGEVRSPAVQVDVDTTPPAVAFTAPMGGATIQESDDVDPGTVGIQIDVRVDAAVEDGQNVGLTVTSPTGDVVTATPQAAAAGKATFRVTFSETGTYRLRTEATTSCGNLGFATINVGVGEAPSVPCVVEITPVPITRPLIAQPVLNAALDPEPATPKFQATVNVRSTAGNTADLFLNLAQVGTRTAVGPGGSATFAVDLDEGLASLQAQCRDQSSNVGTSDNNLVFVDTVAPVCAITAPANGSIIIPAGDIDPATPDTQFNVTATVVGTPIQPSGTDTDAQPAQFSIDGAVQTAAVTGGAASVVGTLGAPKASVPIVLDASDRAGNTCQAGVTVGYQTDGCSIELTAPTVTVTTDGNATLAGIQANVSYQLGATCAGKTVTLTGCDVGADPLTAVATGGATPTATFVDVTLCTLESCPLSSRTCRASVQNDAGITTSLTSTISVDTQPPLLSVNTFQPLNRCGATVTAIDDIDANPANGVQIRVQVTGVAASRWVETTPPGDGTQIPLVDGAFADITLADGQNVIIARGIDVSGLTGTSPPCTVNLATLAVAITQPLNGAQLGTDDGTVVGPNLQIQVCGTVGSPAAASVNVRVDGQAAGQVAATVNPDGTWCANNVPVPVGPHALDAVASAGAGANGTASISVTVDIAGPGPPTNFTTAVTRRNAVQVGWTAPDDGSGGAVATCQIRLSATPIADEAAWNALAAGIIISGVPPGQPQSVLVTPLKTGRPFFFGVRCFDTAGNGSPVVQNADAITLAFTSSAAVAPLQFDDWDVSFAQLGTGATGADLNDDGFTDLVVGAPFACRPAGAACVPNGSFGPGVVYVYLGGPTGVSTTPSFAIRGTDAGQAEALGNSITTLDWNGDGVDDIAIGAPYADGFQGRVFLFLGESGAGSKWAPAATLTKLDDTAADVSFVGDQLEPFVTGGVFFGFQLASLDFDGDGAQDLAIAVPDAIDASPTDFSGGVIVVHAPPAGTPMLAQVRIPQDLGSGAGKAGTTGVGFAFHGGHEYGSVIGALGRLNNDNPEDLGVGPANRTDAGFRPSAKVIYGRPQTSSAFVLLDENDEVRETILAPATQNLSSYPQSLASIQDINNDGRRDIMGGDDVSGRIWVVPGGIGPLDPPITRTLPGDALLEFVGAGTSNRTGAGLANDADGLGSDVDGDGVEDIVAAALSRAVYIWYGGETPLSAANDDTVAGPPSFIGATGVFWIGDTDGNGLADLVFVDAQPQVPGPGAFVILR